MPLGGTIFKIVDSDSPANGLKSIFYIFICTTNYNLVVDFEYRDERYTAGNTIRLVSKDLLTNFLLLSLSAMSVLSTTA